MKTRAEVNEIETRKIIKKLNKKIKLIILKKKKSIKSIKLADFLQSSTGMN